MVRLPREKAGWAALALWLLAFLVVGGDAVRRPLVHTTTPTYRTASVDWWAGIDPYTYNSHSGFLYFPQAAILYTPFTWGPTLFGDLVWRAAIFGLLALALVRMTRIFLRGDPRDFSRLFLLLTVLAVPSSLASLRNAQFDLPLSALILLATAAVAETGWAAAATWLCLAVALKPLAVVPLLLFGALYPRPLLPRLALGLLIALLVPFVNPHPAFVANEYVRCVQTLGWAAQPHEPKFSDLAALAGRIHLTLPDEAWTVMRLVFALGFLGLGVRAVLRQSVRVAAWTIGALAAAYLMLFNPRTETCSYVLLAPFTATLAILEWPRHRRLAWALGLGSICCACDSIPGLFHLTDRWLKPLVALLFIPVVVARMEASRESNVL